MTTPDSIMSVAAPELDSEIEIPVMEAEEAATGCVECGEPLQAHWKMCPVCGTEPETISGPVAVVCDDSALIRTLVRSALNPLFARVYEASDGKEGLDIVARTSPAILVVDYEMPEMTGVEVIRELRSHVETATLPIVMLTATDSADLEGEVFEAGADDYLQKPITVERLRRRVQGLLAAFERAVNRSGV